MRTAVLLQQYVASRKEAGRELAPRTVLEMRKSLRKLPSIWPTTLHRMAASLISIGGLAIETRRSHIRRWRTLGNFAEKTGLPNPTALVPMPPPSKQLRRTFTAEETALLFDVAQTDIDRVYLELLFGTGIRKGECPLWADKIRHNCIEVDGKTGPRLVAILPRVRDLLVGTGDGTRLWISPNTGKPLELDGLNTRYRRLIESAGLTGRKLGQHTIRHTFATTFLERGGDLMTLRDQLGHQDLRSTQAYIHLSVDARLQELARVNPTEYLLRMDRRPRVVRVAL